MIIIIGASLLIGFILWWFFGKRTVRELEAGMRGNKQEVEVVINGGYIPNTVVFKKGVPGRILFHRKDPSNCFNEIVFPDFGVNKRLVIGETYPIDIDTSMPGEYQYACGMNMFFGKVIIK